jgi:phosphate transport system substrate-binding protein
MQHKSCVKVFLAAALLSLLLGGCGNTGKSGDEKLSGTLTISGAWALYPMVVQWGEEFQKVYPDVQFDISAGGAGKGMTDALSGAADIGMVSREVKQEELDQGAFWITVVADAVLPTINASNPQLARIQAQGLTRADFEAIWMGKAKTWGDVLGDPSITDEIHVYTRSDACGAAKPGRSTSASTSRRICRAWPSTATPVWRKPSPKTRWDRLQQSQLRLRYEHQQAHRGPSNCADRCE